jgi:hypothetical protein
MYYNTYLDEKKITPGEEHLIKYLRISKEIECPNGSKRKKTDRELLGYLKRFQYRDDVAKTRKFINILYSKSAKLNQSQINEIVEGTTFIFSKPYIDFILLERKVKDMSKQQIDAMVLGEKL